MSMSSMTHLQRAMLHTIETALRCHGVAAASPALNIAIAMDAFPRDVTQHWINVLAMAQEAETDIWKQEVEALVSSIEFQNAQMQEWHDTQASLEASVRL